MTESELEYFKNIEILQAKQNGFNIINISDFFKDDIINDSYLDYLINQIFSVGGFYYYKLQFTQSFAIKTYWEDEARRYKEALDLIIFYLHNSDFYLTIRVKQKSELLFLY